MFDAFVERKNGFNFPLWVSLLSWLFGWILRSKLMWVSLNIGLLILKSHGISRLSNGFLSFFKSANSFFGLSCVSQDSTTGRWRRPGVGGRKAGYRKV
jgi:hypothetical protein